MGGIREVKNRPGSRTFGDDSSVRQSAVDHMMTVSFFASFLHAFGMFALQMI